MPLDVIKKCITLCIVLLATNITDISEAAAVTNIYKFSATVSDVSFLNENSVLGALVPGDIVTGNFLYDPNGGFIQPGSVTLTTSELQVSYEGPGFELRSGDNFVGRTGIPYDFFVIEASGLSDKYLFSDFGVNLFDLTASVFTAKMTLPERLSLQDFGSGRIDLLGSEVSTGSRFRVYSDITELIIVPEPGFLVFLLAGMCFRLPRRPAG